jgi:hypothetical protein
MPFPKRASVSVDSGVDPIGGKNDCIESSLKSVDGERNGSLNSPLES